MKRYSFSLTSLAVCHASDLGAWDLFCGVWVHAPAHTKAVNALLALPQAIGSAAGEGDRIEGVFHEGEDGEA